MNSPDTPGQSGPFRIFLSYRRVDAPGYAGRLHDFLQDGVGDQPGFATEQIFMDIDTLRPGEDFRKAIREAVASCDVFLALIGPQWTAVEDRNGRRRLQDPADYVRLELEAAFERDIAVVPLLVQGAEMPGEDDLPESLMNLAYRHAVELSHTRWEHDVGRLLTSLKKREHEKAKRTSPSQSEESERQKAAGKQPSTSKPAPVAALVAPATSTSLELFRDAIRGLFRGLGPLRYSVVFAATAFILLTTAPDDSRPALISSVAWHGSPLNRVGTLMIGAGLAVAAAMTATRPALRQGATAFVVALGLLELCGAIATVALRRTDVPAGSPDYGVPLGWDSEIAAGVSMALAAILAAATLHYGRRPRHLKPSWAALLVTVVATATIVWSLSIAQYAAEDGTKLRLGYGANAFHIEPVAIAVASIIGVLLAYKATASVAAGWLAATATNTLLYVAGVVLAVKDFATPQNEEGLTVYWGCLVLFGTAVLLGLATALLVRVARRTPAGQ